jgi:hypothetical protein
MPGELPRREAGFPRRAGGPGRDCNHDNVFSYVSLAGSDPRARVGRPTIGSFRTYPWSTAAGASSRQERPLLPMIFTERRHWLPVIAREHAIVIADISNAPN